MDKFFDFDEQATLFEDMSGFTFTELSQAIECIFNCFGVGTYHLVGKDKYSLSSESAEWKPCTGRRLFTLFAQYEWLRRLSDCDDQIVTATKRTELARFNDTYGSTYHGLAGTVLLNLMDMHAGGLSGLVGAVTRWDELPPEAKKQIATWEQEHNRDGLEKLACLIRSERLIYERSFERISPASTAREQARPGDALAHESGDAGKQPEWTEPRRAGEWIGLLKDNGRSITEGEWRTFIKKMVQCECCQRLDERFKPSETGRLYRFHVERSRQHRVTIE